MQTEKARELVANMQGEIAALSLMFDGLPGAVQTPEPTVDQKAEWQNQVDQLKQQLEQSQTSLAAANTEIEILKKEVATLTTQIASLKVPPGQAKDKSK